MAKVEPSRWSAAVFDFDGTLAPNLDLPGMRREVRDCTLAAGVPATVIDNHYIVEMIDHARAWLDEREAELANNYFLTAHQIILRIELDAAAITAPFPGVPDALMRLRSAGIGVGVVTRNCEAAVRATFPDLDSYADVVLARDNVEHIKPDHRHVTAALHVLDSTPEAALMVGDGAMDMRVGKQLGMQCIGVLSGSGNAAELEAAGADLVMEHATQIQALLP